MEDLEVDIVVEAQAIVEEEVLIRPGEEVAEEALSAVRGP